MSVFPSLHAQNITNAFNVIAFYTGKADQAHISFIKEANIWFKNKAETNNFTYTATSNWDSLTDKVLEQYQVVIFLDSRPEKKFQREAFQRYMDKQGAWIGFHFAGFALNPSAYPQNWDWYHTKFLGSGEYKSNTWRPTSAILRVENGNHPSTRHLPQTFISSPNEWYSWTTDLRTHPDIQILVSIDTTSYPLGTGPKSYEIWHSGYYPVAWTNKKI